MEHPVKSGSVTIALLVAVAASASSSAHVLERHGDVELTLDCVDSTHITFAIRNVGESDTAVRLGSIIGADKYTIDDLRLRQKSTTDQITETKYQPRRYPDRVGGRLEEWIQPIPARSSYVMSAESNDFWQFRQPPGRKSVPFPAGAELSVTVTILEPRSDAMWRAFWSGTLTSNSCTP
jgi:hypothetical protein